MNLRWVFSWLQPAAAALLLAVVAATAGAAAQHPATILITGANTGHGLAFTEEYAASRSRCRWRYPTGPARPG